MTTLMNTDFNQLCGLCVEIKKKKEESFLSLLLHRIWQQLTCRYLEVKSSDRMACYYLLLQNKNIVVQEKEKQPHSLVDAK